MGDLPYVVLSTIVVGGASLRTIQSAVDATVSVNALVGGEHTAIGLLKWMASKYGFSFTGRDGVVIGNARLLNLKRASPFEFTVGEQRLTFLIDRVGLARIGGIHALQKSFSYAEEPDGRLAVDVSTRSEALTLHKILFGPVTPRPTDIGRPYITVGVVTGVAQAEPFTVDPAIIDRGNQGHASTQDAVADFLRTIGIEPRSPASGEPDFDLAWCVGGRIWVAEVKSTTLANEEAQLRLGLGQVLRYRYALAAGGREVTAVLVCERRPSDLTWGELCRSLGVLLVWPGVLEELTPGTDGEEVEE